MDTAIIIGLVVLIVVVGIAIIFVSIKGKKDEKSTEDTSSVSPITFQEDTPKQDITPQEPQMFTPQMQTPVPVSQPEAPVLSQSLDQPMNQPIMQTQTVPVQPIEDIVTQTSNPVPDVAQMNQDMSQFTQDIPVVDNPTLEPTTPPSQDQVDTDMKTIMDALNTTPTTPTIEPTTPLPTLDSNPVVTAPKIDSINDMSNVPYMPEINNIPTPDVAPVMDNSIPAPVTPSVDSTTPPVPPMGI